MCAYNYYECQYINKTRCTNPQTPFLCNDKCVSNMATECCPRTSPDLKWCPHLNTCINSTAQSCPTLNSSTMIYCKSKNTFVRFRHECCDDIFYNTSLLNGTLVSKPMVKCSNEDKCVPLDNDDYCFSSFPRDCLELGGVEFGYQCRNDGKCRRNQVECPSTRVCPPGYT